MIEYSFSLVFYITVLKVFNKDSSREVLNMTSRVLKNEFNTNFESYRVGI